MAYIGKTPSSGIRNRFIYTATAGQTTFSGTDDHSRTLSYTDAEFTDVFLNGVKLDKSDYTATSGTSIVLDEGAAVDDILEVLAFDTFSVFSGEFSQDVTVGGTLDANGNVDVAGDTTMTGDLTVDTDTLYVDSTNNRVGIGTTSGYEAFHVKVGASGQSSAARDGAVIEGNGHTGLSILTPSSHTANICFGDESDNDVGQIRYLHGDNAMAFTVNASERMRITNAGSVYQAGGNHFIGINQPSGSYASGERSHFVYAGSSSNYTQTAGRNAADGSAVFAAVVGGTTRAEIEANGDYQSATNSYGSTSDQTLKENIVASGSQWDDIKAVQVKKFSYIRDNLDSPNMIGVVAQDLEASGMSGLVSTMDDADGNTYKTVKYSVLYMKAIKALQEAMTKIETLETENTTQATQIADLITRVTALEASD